MKNIFSIFMLILPVHSYANVTGNIHFTNNYIDRGISNSAGGPAIQGGIDYYNELGAYAGIWASTIDFQLGRDEPSYEFDIYGGVTGELADTEWDIGFLYFTYPNAASRFRLDAHEFYIGLSRNIHDITMSAYYNYSPDYSGAENSHYLEANIAIPLPYKFNLSVHVGHQRFEDNYWYNLPDYNDWRIAVERDVAGFILELAWSDTNIKNNKACFSGTDWCDSKFTLDIHRDFELF